MSKVLTYLSFVRFSHSVFALPFALTGALLAWREQPFSWMQVLWIVVCMVSARSAAMGFNRLVDARFDAMNPRTSMRELPRGAMSMTEAALIAVSIPADVSDVEEYLLSGIQPGQLRWLGNSESQ